MKSTYSRVILFAFHIAREHAPDFLAEVKDGLPASTTNIRFMFFQLIKPLQ